MVSVNHEDLSLAFSFVSSDSLLMNEAYISLDTGRIFWISDLSPDEEQDIPDDLATSDRYLPIPHKNDLDLGKRLALRFAARELPQRCYEQAEDFFQHKGAYARFKQMLQQEGALEQWYKFDADATEEALRDWCAENDIQLVEERDGK